MIEEHISKITGRRKCGEWAREVLDKTSHLVKARSVAYAASFCVYAARLAEAMGVTGFWHSILPGKGSLVHKLLAVAFPLMILENREKLARGPSHALPRDAAGYIEEAEKRLESADIPITDEAERRVLDAARRDAAAMLENAARFVSEASNRVGLDLMRARVYSEMQLISYRLHVWGVLDALVEDPYSRRALVVEWKSGVENGKAPTVHDWELAQVHVYALMEADRLGYEDPKDAVLKGYVVPAIVKPRGRYPVYSISPKYKTSERRESLEELLDNVVLAAEHLTLIVCNVQELVGREADVLCRIKGYRGRLISAFRKVPEGLRGGNPKNEVLRWPCKACNMREECLFYIYSSEEPDELDRLAWKTRHAIYKVRENALEPYKALREFLAGEDIWRLPSEERSRLVEEAVQRLAGKLGTGNRFDVFEEAYATGSGLVLLRKAREYEERQERVMTVREGKPVAVFFGEMHVRDPLLLLTYTGRVGEVSIEGSELSVHVCAPNITSKLTDVLFELYLSKWPELSTAVLALETNVDLTQLELKAIDAFQRGTKHAIQAFKETGEAPKSIEEFKEKALAELFGTIPRWPRRR